MFENVPDGIVGVFTLPYAGVKSNKKIRLKHYMSAAEVTVHTVSCTCCTASG